MDSIWKDIYVDFGAVASVNYNVEVTGYGEVFNGKAFARPGASTCLVRINDIIADAFGMLRSLPWSTFSGLSWPMEVVVNNLDSNTEEYREQVLMDWSYDYGYTPGTDAVSDPITGIVHFSQYFVRSLITTPFPASLNVKETDKNGVVTTETIATNEAANYWKDSHFLRRLVAAGSGTFVVDMASLLGSPVLMEVDGYKYPVTGCGDYVLYYINAFGGWDSLLLHDKIKQQDGLTRHTVGVDFNNTDPYQRGKVNYVNELQRHFTMRTGWLTDAQSAKMHHLLNSPCVYLHRVASYADIRPVVLTNPTTEYKTFQNQGLRMVDYVVEADLAVDMMRQ